MARMLRGILGLAIVAALGASASAAVKTDTFTVDIIRANELNSGEGSGWNGEFVHYPNTDWWNMWFYDDLPDPARWKQITYDITMYVEVSPDLTEVAINWSTMDYLTNPVQPPVPPMSPEEEEAWIVRHVIFSGQAEYGQQLVGTIIIPDYNPEWVSIDIRSYDEQWDVYATGTITHECLPEPATLGLLALGGLGMLLRRKRT
jgi:hypothetical protein